MSRTPKIYNGTNHCFNVYAKKDVYYSNEKGHWVVKGGSCPTLSLRKQKPLNVFFKTAHSQIGQICITDRAVTSFDYLPLGYDLYVVSATYAEHCSDPRARVAVSPVYNKKGRVVGCLSLGRTIKKERKADDRKEHKDRNNPPKEAFKVSASL